MKTWIYQTSPKDFFHLFTGWKKILPRWHRDQKGATAVEVALLAPIIFLMIFGIIEAGRSLWLLNTLQRSAEATARFAVVNSSATDAALATQAETFAVGIDSSNLIIVITHDTTGGVNFVTVTVSYDYSAVTNLVGIDPVTLTGLSRVPFNN